MRPPGPSTKTPSACSPPPVGNLPYRLPERPPVIYISAVSRPNNVLEVQASGHKPRTLTPAFCNVNAAGVPGALCKRQRVCSVSPSYFCSSPNFHFTTLPPPP